MSHVRLMSITLLLFELNWLLSYALSVSTASGWSCGIDPHLVNLRTWQCDQFFRLTLCVYVWFGGRHINSRKVRKCLPQFLVSFGSNRLMGPQRQVQTRNIVGVDWPARISHLSMWNPESTCCFDGGLWPRCLFHLFSAGRHLFAAYARLKRGLFWSI